MRRPFSSIKRHASIAALGVLLAGLAGCGTASRDNPFAPNVGMGSEAVTLNASGRASKHIPGEGRGVQKKSQSSAGTSSGVTSGGVTSGSFNDPGTGEHPADGLITE